MSEWWTYRLSDLLMFSSRSYFRLIALYNEAVWPAHIVAIMAGLVLIGCIARSSLQVQRIALLLLAAAWAWIAWAYHLQRYADINTAASYFAVAFAVQAVLLCTTALRPKYAPSHEARKWAAIGITGFAVIVYPMLALANNRNWMQAEVFGIAPDPTALATLGILLAWRSNPFIWLIPLAWCCVSGATLHELRAAHAWLLPTLAATVALLGWRLNSTTTRRS